MSCLSNVHDQLQLQPLPSVHHQLQPLHSLPSTAASLRPTYSLSDADVFWLNNRPYWIHGILGKGGFGCVWKVIFRNTCRAADPLRHGGGATSTALVTSRVVMNSTDLLYMCHEEVHSVCVCDGAVHRLDRLPVKYCVRIFRRGILYRAC